MFELKGRVGGEKVWLHKCPQGKLLMMTESHLGIEPASVRWRKRHPERIDERPEGCAFCGNKP